MLISGTGPRSILYLIVLSNNSMCYSEQAATSLWAIVRRGVAATQDSPVYSVPRTGQPQVQLDRIHGNTNDACSTLDTVFVQAARRSASSAGAGRESGSNW
jgi:hypothetical protein